MVPIVGEVQLGVASAQDCTGWAISGAMKSVTGAGLTDAPAWLVEGPEALVTVGCLEVSCAFCECWFPPFPALANDVSRNWAKAEIKLFVRAVGIPIAISEFVTAATVSALTIALVSIGIDLVETGMTECTLVAKSADHGR